MDYDLFIIGTGTAGTSAASICSKGGMKVAIADYRSLGGTCALRGCAPKKVLVGSATLYEHLRRMTRRGVFPEGPTLSWKGLMAFKRRFIDPFPAIRAEEYRRMGVDVCSGVVSFIDKNTARVGDRTFTSKKFLIASGSAPRALNIPGEEHMVTSEGFMDLDDLPGSIVFVGGGYISFEFAHLAALAGSKVTILHKGGRPLANFEKDLVSRLLKVTAKLGIDVVLNAEVTSIEKKGDSYVTVADARGIRSPYVSDCVVHGAGRVPEIDALDLGRAGVDHTQRGVRVNGFLQSVSNPDIYAAGDAVEGTYMLKPVSENEGFVAGRNILEGNVVKVDHDVVPSVLFTVPEIASVGRSESELKSGGEDYDVVENDMSDWFSTRYLGMDNAYSKVLKRKSDGRILGAHIMSPRAGEIINLFTLAIRCGMDSETLKTVPWAFPTNTSDMPRLV